MKRKTITRVAGLSLALTLVASTLAGCANNNNQGGEPTISNKSGTFDLTAAEGISYPEQYTSVYSSKKEALEAGLALNETIAEEGMILLKNEDSALPLAKGAKITLLGYAAVAPQAGGSMNGGDASGGVAFAQATVISSLEDAGFSLNKTILDQYTAWGEEVVPGTENNENPTLKTADYYLGDDFSAASQTDDWKNSIAEYSDAAVVVIAGGAGPVEAGGRVHNLQLDKEQYALIDYATANFDKVIVFLNSCTPLEVSRIQANSSVKAILNIGEPGDNGFQALGRIVSGEANPSGRTTDTWAKDFTKNPSYVNFNTRTDGGGFAADGNGTMTGYTQYTVNGEPVNTWSVGYEEGIYVGYRYYETRAAVEGGSWWDDNVVYTFGYGKSYTDFEWTVTPKTSAGSTIKKGDTLEFDVTVKNNGTVAGKDVVELYYTAPFGTEATGNDTVIEKAHVVLGDFVKTGIIEPGQSETVSLAIDVNDMASYDEKTDKTYVLDAGTYNIKISESAHYGLGNNDADFDYSVEAKELCDTAVTGAKITNALDDVTEGFASEGYSQMSRSDFAGTIPTSVTTSKEISEEEYNTWAYDDAKYNSYYDAAAIGTPVYAEEENDASNGNHYETVLGDLIGAPADDPRFQELVEQLTLDQLIELVNFGGFNSHGFEYIGKPYSRDTDGPKGWTGNYTDSNDRFNYFSSEPMIAATFNRDLAYQMGEIIGEQGLWGNSTIENGKVFNYTGWYAPGMNIHRSPFDGRYTEYYSEDPVLTGAIATNASLGAKSKGCYITLKHFAFHNDGSGATTYRFGPFAMTGEGTKMDGLSAWMTEQAAREVYLKGYQMAVEDGEATFAMGSFTRIGKTWCSGSYAINNVITRGEWGFEGAIVTDITLYESCDAYQLIKSGANLMLDAFVYGINGGQFLDKDTILAMPEADKNITIYCLQNAAKQVFYMVANSNAMQLPKGTKVAYSTTIIENEEEKELTLEDGKVGEEYTSPNVLIAELNTFYAYSGISYHAEGIPDGLSINEAGEITGTPTKAGDYTITITASAEGYESGSISLPLTIAE